jgi:hypothetical protein
MTRNALIYLMAWIMSVTVFFSPAYAICDVEVDMSGKWAVREIDTLTAILGGITAALGEGEQYKLEISRIDSRYQIERTDADVEILGVATKDRRLTIKGVHPVHDFFEMSIEFDVDMRTFEGRISYTQLQPPRKIIGSRTSSWLSTARETKMECLDRLIGEMEVKLKAADAHVIRWRKRYGEEQRELKLRETELEVAKAASDSAVRNSLVSESQIRTLRANLEESTDKIRKLKSSSSRVDRLESKLKKFDRINKELKFENANLLAEKSKAVENLRRYKQQTDDEDEMESLVATLRRNLMNETNRTRKLNEKARRLQSDNDDIRRKLLAAKDRISTLRTSIDKMTAKAAVINSPNQERWPINGEKKK